MLGNEHNSNRCIISPVGHHRGLCLLLAFSRRYRSLDYALSRFHLNCPQYADQYLDNPVGHFGVYFDFGNEHLNGDNQPANDKKHKFHCQHDDILSNDSEGDLSSAPFV